ncbi:MAG: metal ABC transporter ATP-binding protein [Eubacterium sp.]|jgi:zinc transport system ATP-binding protein|nr:metal ABC transporter ATP-binding protein [Eubacterium sp.]
MPQLTCRELILGYEGNTVVSGLSFDVNSGDYLCIVGENGSGKSTLIKALLKLKAPTSGKILIGDGLKRGEIGYLPQQTLVQKDFPASVKEVVRSGCLNRLGLRPFYGVLEKRMADKNMKKLGIADLSNRCYRELSGGQQQRVLLARALCATKKLLLLDEPVAGLDPKASAELYFHIKKLNDDGTTIVMISHDIAAAVKYASHILHIGDRTPLFFGVMRKYLESETGRIYAGLAGENI